MKWDIAMMWMAPFAVCWIQRLRHTVAQDLVLRISLSLNIIALMLMNVTEKLRFLENISLVLAGILLSSMII